MVICADAVGKMLVVFIVAVCMQMPLKRLTEKVWTYGSGAETSLCVS